MSEAKQVGQLYINGTFKPAEDGQTFEVLNPYTLAIIGEQAEASEKDIQAAIDGAVQAFRTWKQTTAYERAGYLRKLLHLMQTREREIAEVMTLEQGKPVAEAVGEVRYAASYVAWYAEEGIRVTGDLLAPSQTDSRLSVRKIPVGPVGIITPWNFPLAMFVRKIAPALAAGCTVIVKPAEQTPLTAVKFFELIHEAGFPAGVCQLLTGEASKIGSAWMASSAIRKISFTGSTAVGKMLMRQASETLKKVSLELGGHAPLIVFDDADLDMAAAGAVESKFRNCGQVCVATNRVLVQRSVYDAFIEKLMKRTSALTFGDGFTNVDMGPIIDKQGFDKIVAHVDDALAKGAKCLLGGKPAKGGGGYLFEPTVLTDVTSAMRIAKEETFGPVLPVFVFDTEAEAIQMANDTPFGLAAYCFTENLSRSIRVTEALEYGMVGLNTGRISAAQAPFGGVKMSGFGREGGRYGIEEYLVTQYIATVYKES
ncbi:NAD-dependent succinate-semialdehyde dehydrogenase [Fusibacter paucivorans]|uniref:Aldehyde dehydrogenase n=1 Tax=Fusibacter paucivorans TaxID=76009 RepID=A0ABS5PK65_9FIRM|nr:NAD-dependent succinate-semialdehyde dehydrogenase [Fusibacter paucivorans]MBS7525555.1 NAD-dependent succinate-semialdehyde dehydrogenase [Fusibacter paucivorans]